MNPRFVTLRRGVLMGDPLTKPVLHLVNILVRTTGAFYTDDHFLTNAFRNDHTLVSDIVKPMFEPKGQTLQSKLDAAFSSKDEEEETEPMPSVPTSLSMTETLFDRKTWIPPTDEPSEVPTRKTEAKPVAPNPYGYSVSAKGMFKRPNVRLDYEHIFKTKGSPVVIKLQREMHETNRETARLNRETLAKAIELDRRRKEQLEINNTLYQYKVLRVVGRTTPKASTSVEVVRPFRGRTPAPRPNSEESPTCSLSMSSILEKLNMFA